MNSVMKPAKNRVCQGDIYRDVACLEYAIESEGVVEISQIVFPYVVVLTQDCDLHQDSKVEQGEMGDHDKRLLSVIVAPLYNAEHVYQGEHLSELQMEMCKINRKKTPGQNLRQNQTPRYHYLEFPPDVPIVPSIVDFKHYFTVNVEYLKQQRPSKHVCCLDYLYREDLSHRFASFLSRIGLPEPDATNANTEQDPLSAS